MININQNINYINCPYPDCEDILESPQDPKDSMIECTLGHQFCAKCKTVGWHIIGKCKSVSIFSENIILNKTLHIISLNIARKFIIKKITTLS
jgi:hypothetical protein